MDHAQVQAANTQKWLHDTILSLIDHEDTLLVNGRLRDECVDFIVFVAAEDIGKVIGRRGSTARILRTLLNARGRKNKTRYSLNIEELK